MRRKPKKGSKAYYEKLFKAWGEELEKVWQDSPLAFSQPLNPDSWSGMYLDDPMPEEALNKLVFGYHPVPPKLTHRFKLKRKNGTIETHLFFSDGSLFNPPVTTYEGDKYLGWI